jgi:DNA-binding MarR family transcriptional regulator
MLESLVSAPAQVRRMYPSGGYAGLGRGELQVLAAFALRDSAATLGVVARQLHLDLGPVSRAARELTKRGLLTSLTPGRGAERALTDSGRALAHEFAEHARLALDESAG